MSTITFNVGGKEFTISKNCVYKSTVLTTLSAGNESKVIFLDYNYDAFAVVLDYLRHERIFIPPTVDAKHVELILSQLGISLKDDNFEVLTSRKSAIPFRPMIGPYEDDTPPKYSPPHIGEKSPLSTQMIGQTDTANLVDQLAITVHQKIADFIISTIRPRITSQALSGAYHTTYVLLPNEVQKDLMMSEFPSSGYTEMVYLEKDAEKFLAQPEVMRRFELALKESLELPMTFRRQDLFFRSENEFGIYGTTTIQALVIDFELGSQP
jgi:hypothetical protein